MHTAHLLTVHTSVSPPDVRTLGLVFWSERVWTSLQGRGRAGGPMSDVYGELGPGGLGWRKGSHIWWQGWARGKGLGPCIVRSNATWVMVILVQFYLILGRANLPWNFYSIPQDSSDIHRFPNRNWVLNTCTVEIRGIPQ